MPWTVADVEEFKKGLSDEKKKRWVRIANSVLRKCREEGGENCEASAIRQASGSVNIENNMDEMIMVAVNKVSQVTYTPVKKYVRNKEYYIVPVVMMVEGVHNGSAGAVYHSADELEKSVPAWEGMPLTLHHPSNENGNFVSAHSEEIMTNWSIGYVSDTEMKGNKLVAKAYVDIQKLTAMSFTTMENIRNGKIMEVSVGVFTEDEEVAGEWNGENYIKIAKNHRPDHLALLPDEVGACSVNDGCGLRVNEEKKGGNESKIENENVIKSMIENHNVEQVDLSTKLNKEVENLQIDKKMCGKCEEKAKELIANANTHFDESDLVWLAELTEDKLDKLIPKTVQVNKESVVTVEKAIEVIQTNSSKLEDYMKILPANMKSQIEIGLKSYNELRNEVITNIQTNTEKDTWSKEDLETMSFETLKKIEKSVSKTNTDYSIYGSRGNKENVVAPMILPD